jgi:glutamate racemase
MLQNNMIMKNIKINNNPIGIFDSGVGGLNIMNEIHKILPMENIVYFADTLNLPYGSKSKNKIIDLSRKISSFLVKKNVKLIVIACNTASIFSLNIIKNFKIPILGVIDPCIKFATLESKNMKIGIIGTEATVNSNLYVNKINKIAKYNVYQQACPLFVPFVEEGIINGNIIDIIIKKYLDSLLKMDIDTLILGCTHYSFLKKALIENIKKKISIIDPSKYMAQEVLNVLRKKSLISENRFKKNYSFLKIYVSCNEKKFKDTYYKLFKKKILNVKKVNLEDM